MKNFFVSLGTLLFAIPAVFAQVAVQRTVESSYEDYIKYLSESGHLSFVQSYIQLASLTEMETPLLEKCLEEIYVGARSQASCLAAVKSLTSKPLNQSRREVLFSFLAKIGRYGSSEQSFYRSLQHGLLRTHPEMSDVFEVPELKPERETEKIQDLEMKAWKKAVQKKFPLQEIALLINGKKVSRLETWTAPAGIYQWTLITNTHEPIVRLARFSQFAAESLKNMKPLAHANCGELPNIDVKKFGLLRLEVFAKPKCVAQFGLNQMISKSTAPSHLGSSTQMVKMEPSSQRHWMWPIIALVGVGLASSLQNKQISVQWPSHQ